SIREPTYLVLEAPAAPGVSPVALYDGRVRYRVTQMENPRSITFQPAGAFTHDCIVQGGIGTVSRDPASVALFHAFRDEFRRLFSLMEGRWLGPEALERFRAGARLTTDFQLRMHDLRRRDS